MKKQLKASTMLAPVPVCMVSCKRENEPANIITIAWTGVCNSDPPMLYVSVRKSRHSHGIIKDTKEFVLNMPSASMAWETDMCGVKSGRDVDKFKKYKLKEEPSNVVGAPGIVGCPVSIECKVKDIIELGSHDMFLAEIVSVNVEEFLIDDKGAVHIEDANLFCYSHGDYYGLTEYIGFHGYSVAKKQNVVRDKAKSAVKQNSKRKKK
jgi:flavin reductase (DIM6/NTAB) family NADH-FMN oxidoreductase RutF